MQARYYTVDGENCIPCPDSSIGPWCIAIGVILVCIFAAYYPGRKKENFDQVEDDEDDDAKNAKKGNSLKRHQSRKDKFGQKLLESSTRRSNHVYSVLQTGFSILAKHTLHFSFYYSTHSVDSCTARNTADYTFLFKFVYVRFEQFCLLARM